MALQSQTFSVGDFTWHSWSNAYLLDLIITEDSVDILQNTSEVSYRLQLRSGPSNRFTDYIDCSVTINGQVISKHDVGITAAYNHTYTLLTGTTTVPHNSDGSMVLEVSGSTWGVSDNRYAPPDLDVSGTVTLTTIPRMATIAASDAYIGSSATIAVSRKSDIFTHSVFYTFGDLSGYLGDSTGTLSDSEVKMTEATILFPLPESFYYQIPDSPSGTCKLCCTTYQDDLVIGTTEATFTVTAKEELCKPSIVGYVEDIDDSTVSLTGDKEKLIRYFSKAKCTASALAQKGALIAEMSVNGVAFDDHVDFPEIETATFTFQATDTRGYSAKHTITLEMVPYIRLTANIFGQRTDPTSGNADILVKGDYFNGSFGAQENTLTIQYRVGNSDYTTVDHALEDNKYFSEARVSGLLYTMSHNIEVVVFDGLSTVTKTLQIGKGIPVFDWGESDFVFHVPISAPNLEAIIARLEALENKNS